MRGLKVPTLFVAGEDDDVVGWKPGVHTLFAGTSAAERFLLVYEQARHNVAPNPPPTAAASHPMDWGHYAEPIWDLRRLNNTNQHFVRAFGDYALGPRDRLPDALDLTPLAADGEIAVDAQGTATAGTGTGGALHRAPPLACSFIALARARTRIASAARVNVLCCGSL